jgi:hypothetical protein
MLSGQNRAAFKTPFFSKKELNRALYFLRFKIPFSFSLLKKFKSSSFEYSNFKTYFGKDDKDGLILVKACRQCFKKGLIFFLRQDGRKSYSWQHLLYR